VIQSIFVPFVIFVVNNLLGVFLSWREKKRDLTTKGTKHTKEEGTFSILNLGIMISLEFAWRLSATPKKSALSFSILPKELFIAETD